MNVNEGRLVHWLSYNRQESFAFRHLWFFCFSFSYIFIVLFLNLQHAQDLLRCRCRLCL